MLGIKNGNRYNEINILLTELTEDKGNFYAGPMILTGIK
jgi:hypothetical protein